MKRCFRHLICFGSFIAILFLPNILQAIEKMWLSFWGHVRLECLWASTTLLFIYILVDYFYWHRREYAKNSVEQYKPELSPFYFDSPTVKDLFNRRSYAKILLEKIFASFYENKRSDRASHSFVIHIGEHFGEGKTSFLMILADEISKRKEHVINIDFEPWLCDTEVGILNEFFETFKSEVGKYIPGLESTVNQYVKLLLSAVEYKNDVLSFKLSSIFGKENSLKHTHDTIRKELMNIDRPIVITIDDVDRLQSKELMMVLKIIRDTADFPNVFYIIAADNLHLQRMLQNMNIDDAKTYLKKFFNLEFQLPANENVAFNRLLKILEDKFQTMSIDDKQYTLYLSQIKRVAYIKEAFPNMRDVYRFVNAYFLAIDSKEYAKQLNLTELFLLTVIQTLDLEYYIQLRDHYLSIFDVIHSNNDIILQWKGEFNIVQKKQEKESWEQIEESEDRRNFKSRKEKHSADVKVPSFEETIENSKIASSDIVPVIMNILFGKSSHAIEENSICRHNMYFKYFANTDATYMTSKTKVVEMLYANEETYRKGLVEEFDQSRDEYFLSEYMHVIPFVLNLGETYLLKRFFIFIEYSYKYKRGFDIVLLYKSLAQYEQTEYCKQKLYPVLSELYGKSTGGSVGGVDENKQFEFGEFCKNEQDINVILVSLGIISNYLGSFVFDRPFVNNTSEMLVKRFFDEKISQSNGELDYQEVDTIIQIKSDNGLDGYWMNIFEPYLKSSKEACFNILSKLIIFFPNNKIDWNWHFKLAILGEHALPEDNILSHLAKTYQEDKDVFDALLSLHRYHSLGEMSRLENNEFVKMAKSWKDEKHTMIC